MSVKIIVGSLNPVKLEATREAFANYYDDIDVLGILGAENRSRSLMILANEKNIFADYFVGIEGGVSNIYDRWFAFGCVCIINEHMQKSFGTSAYFELPESITERLLKREELGAIMDEVMNMSNTKQKGGAISFFTNGVMSRKELYIPGIISALVPFNHEDLYFKSN